MGFSSTDAKTSNPRQLKQVSSDNADAALRDAEADLLYTGVTRGKRLVVLVGQKKAVATRYATLQDAGAGRSWTSGWLVRRAVRNPASSPEPELREDLR